MHAFKEDFESYFLQFDETLEEEYRLDGDILWIKGTEAITVPKVEKTIKGLKFFLDRKDEFDYIIRPNLSSFVVLPRLKNFLKGKPKKRFYGGNLVEDSNFISGACFILSTDLMESIVLKEQYFFGKEYEPDDVVIGDFLVHEMSIQPFHHPNFHFLKKCRVKKNPWCLPEEVFHFRIKLERDREEFEGIIHKDLLSIFYPELIGDKKKFRKSSF
jgi:hypothetical protein